MILPMHLLKLKYLEYRLVNKYYVCFGVCKSIRGRKQQKKKKKKWRVKEKEKEKVLDRLQDIFHKNTISSKLFSRAR